MKSLFKKLCVLIMFFIITISVCVNAAAAEKCININGINGIMPLANANKNIKFEIPSNVEIKNNSYMDLDFMMSSKNNNYEYNLQIILNKKMIKEIDLNNAKNNRKNLKIDIPKDNLKNGNNKLEIKVIPKYKNIKISNEDKITIFGETFIHIEI